VDRYVRFLKESRADHPDHREEFREFAVASQGHLRRSAYLLWVATAPGRPDRLERTPLAADQTDRPVLVADARLLPVERQVRQEASARRPVADADRLPGQQQPSQDRRHAVVIPLRVLA